MRKRKLKKKLKRLKAALEWRLDAHGKALDQQRAQLHALTEQVRESDKQIEGLCS